MCVNRIHFRYGKTLILSGCLTAASSYAQPKPDQTGVLESTPDWARGIVWYQVFPERFRNENPDNDPQGVDLFTAHWDQDFDDISIEEIESVWLRQKYNPKRFGFDPDRPGGIARNAIFERRYGGDLQGVYDQLDEIAAMGVGGIYLCPVFESRSLHKYDAWDHRHIDPTLAHPGAYNDTEISGITLRPNEDPADESTWAWTPSDQWFVDVFLPRAKALGMRVILDGVWNHVGLGHWGFRDVQVHGRDSRFSSWFDVRFNDDGQLIGWRSWNGNNGNLPVFQQVKGDLAPGPKEHVFAVTRRWMDPNGDGDPSDGIDGWRLDVANEIGRTFWKDWREEVRTLNPRALIIGELWFDGEEYFDGTAFDGQMNYPLAFALADWLSIGGEAVGDGQLFANRANAIFHHGAEHDLVHMNLISSHDTERLASMMHNSFARGFDRDADRWGESGYDAGDVDARAMERSLMMYAALVALPGSPMIYNGDEYAMPGADDPDNRRPVQWDSLTEQQVQYRDSMAWLMKLRTSPDIGSALRLGDVEVRPDNDGVGIVVRRRLEGEVVEISIGPDSSNHDGNHVFVPQSMESWLHITKVPLP